MIRPVDLSPTQLYGDNPTSIIRPGSPDYWIIELYGNYQPDGHAGEDYPCKAGTPVRAVTDGVVLHIGRLGGAYADNPWWIAPNFAGFVVVIDHGSFIGIYGHCMDGSGKVRAGQRVSEGQVFVLSGNTGASTGDHLHFEILFKPFLVNSYMYGRSNPETLFSGIQFQSGAITPLEEIDVAAEENLMARLNQIVEWTDAKFREARENDENNRNLLAGFVRDVVNAKDTITPAQIDAKFAELAAVKEPPGQILFKGDADPSVYAWDASAGFRGIGYDEYLTLTLAGAVLKVLPQAIIDAALTAGK